MNVLQLLVRCGSVEPLVVIKRLQNQNHGGIVKPVVDLC